MIPLPRALSRLLVGCCALVAPQAGAGEGAVALLSEQLQALGNLPSALRAAEVRSVTAHRAEVYADAGDIVLAVALVAHLEAVSPAAKRHLGGAACRMALIRPQLKGFDGWVDRRKPDDDLLDSVSRLATGSVELRGVRVLANREDRDWVMEACQVPRMGLRAIDFTADADGILSQAAYLLAKEHIARGEADAALERLKLTVAAPEVYVNAVALMVPLLREQAPDVAARLEHQYLALDRLTDADAAAFLGRDSEVRGAFNLAEAAFRRCLILDPQRRECQGHIEELFRRAPTVSDEGAIPAGAPGSTVILPAAR